MPGGIPIHRLLATSLALCVAAVALPAAHSAADAQLPAWLAEALDARGVQADAAGLRVMRTVTGAAGTSTFEVPLSALVQEDPFSGRDVATPSTSEVLVGELTQHVMIQFDCAGYNVQQVAPGVDSVQGSWWDYGFHYALGPLGGGVAVGTGTDPTAPGNLVIIANEDTGMEQAVGRFSTTYDRVEFFGVCLLGVGAMTGTGAWLFS